MADDDRSQPPSGGGFPPSPPVDEPRTDPSRGSLVRGAVLGFAATAVTPVAPLMTYATGSEWWSLPIWLIPIVLLAGISLAIRGSTRRTGIGLLLGFAVAVVVLAGATIALYNIDEG